MKKVVRKRKPKKINADPLSLGNGLIPAASTLDMLNPQVRTQDPSSLQPNWIKPLPLEEELEPPKPQEIKIPLTVLVGTTLEFITPGQLQSRRKSEVETMAQQYLDQLNHELVLESTLNPDLVEYVWQLPEAPIDVIVLVVAAITTAGFSASWDGEITIRIAMPAMPVQGYRTRREYTSSVKPL